ncbi:MAG: LytTR family DNA-binding domain-containing protein [Paludibacteraceae bacterium]|nr:LytTR family DNA-binding domain-containing protein [Paludibacteraceae bacterium]
MNCIIVDDEPLAREAVELLVRDVPQLSLLGCFNNAETAGDFIANNHVDLVFLDIQMPGVSGLEFARRIPKETLVIFTTAFAEYAMNSYEVDAVDYLIKPIDEARFKKAVEKALTYLELLSQKEKEKLEVSSQPQEFFFVKSDRKFHKVRFDDILFVEGLKDYVIIQIEGQKIITRMNMKGIVDLLPSNIFMRVNKSYIINTTKIDSFDNNDIFIKNFEIPIGNSYRDAFFNDYVSKF